jgi:hypothetical protein
MTADPADLARAGIFSPQRLEDRAVDEFIGICRGVLFDGEVSDKDIVRLEAWCKSHRAAFAQWPLDVIATRLARVLEDGLVEEEERKDLQAMLAELVGGEAEGVQASTNLPLTQPAPTVLFPEHLFCFTGTFAFGTRKVCEAAVMARQARCTRSISSSVQYLVIGSRATRAWMHSSYGRKIEAAVELAREGHDVSIISEQHWTRALVLVGQYDPAVVEERLLWAIRNKKPVEFLYRGSCRVILPTAFVTWLEQRAIEGNYLDGDSPDPDRPVRQYLLQHISSPKIVGAP